MWYPMAHAWPLAEQILYHIHLMDNYEHILLGGFHIEEQVYGPRYYSHGSRVILTEAA